MQLAAQHLGIECQVSQIAKVAQVSKATLKKNFNLVQTVLPQPQTAACVQVQAALQTQPVNGVSRAPKRQLSGGVDRDAPRMKRMATGSTPERAQHKEATQADACLSYSSAVRACQSRGGWGNEDAPTVINNMSWVSDSSRPSAAAAAMPREAILDMDDL